MAARRAATTYIAEHPHRSYAVAGERNKSMERSQEEPAKGPGPKGPTPAITLRKFRDSDAEAFMSWASDPRVVRFQRRGPYTDIAEAREYLAAHVMPHPWYRAICVGDRPVGSISVKPAGPGEERFKAAVGYRIAYDYWGRGIATRALRVAMEAVFEEWPELERLEAVADVENPASQRVLEKAGFLREGVLRKYIMLKGAARDMVVFSYLDTDRRAVAGM